MATVKVLTVLISLLAFCNCVPLGLSAPRPSPDNDRPIIGVAAQETPQFISGGDTYISASYVSFLQQSGARVVAVRAGEPLDYYTDLFSKLNGMVFPGGIVNILNSMFSRTAQIFYSLAVQAAKEGDYFPLWGVCLGHQMFAVFTAGENLLNVTDTENLTVPLDFVPGFRESRMFAKAPEEVVTFLQKDALAQNNHEHSLMMDVFNNNPKLTNFYRVLSTNTDRQGETFVSTYEAKDYPFYGVQWHPEKVAYNWDWRFNINHNRHAVRVAQYFSNFFVDEARRSSHRFPSAEEETAADINNYDAVFVTDHFVFNVYFFNLTETAVMETMMPEFL